MKTVNFLGEECTLSIQHYQGTKAPAIQLFAIDGPMAKATVNLTEPPPKGCIFIKDYSENQGMAQAFQKANLGEEIARTSSGYAENGVSIFRITDPELLKACYPSKKTKKTPSPQQDSPEP